MAVSLGDSTHYAFLCDNPSSIGSMDADAGSIVNTSYFDLSGRRVSAPTAGIYIRQQQPKNGNVVTRKVVVK